jgi:molybdopterin converting factor small subunit
MRIHVRYTAQVRAAAGRNEETLDLPQAASVEDLLRSVGARHGEAMQRLVLRPDQTPQPSLLLFVNDLQWRPSEPSALSEGDQVAIMSPIAGG